MNPKNIRTFIRQNRKEIDEVIRKQCPSIGKLNDEDRRQWILNYEPLYLWARSDRVQNI